MKNSALFDEGKLGFAERILNGYLFLTMFIVDPSIFV
jgi:hypothetical protein